MKLLSLLKEISLHPKNAEELKGLILQLAIQGKLTAKWRNNNSNIESASVLLEKIKAEKKELIKLKKIKKSKPLDVISDAEKHFNIPETWIWERLGNIGNVFNGDSVNKAIKEAKYTGLNEGYPYIATKDVGYGFESINDRNGVKIPHDEPKFKIAHKGTVIICSEGGSAGKKMGMLLQDCCFGNKLYAIEQFGGIKSVYILALYGSPFFKAAFQEKMSGIIGGISKSNFIELLIPLPPVEEQKAIVEVVNTLFKEVKALENLTKERISLIENFVSSALRRLTETDNTTQEWNYLQQHFSSFFTEKKNIKSLRETILQLAVQGNLTAKWREANPSVEHASELLKRIEAEKQQLIAEKKIKAEKPLPPIEEEDIPYNLPAGWVWCRMVDTFIIGSSKRVFKHDYVAEGVPFFRSKEIGQLGRGEEVSTELFISRERFEDFKKNFGVSNPGDVLMACIGGSIGNTWLVDDREFYYKDGNLVQIRSVEDIEGDYLLKYLDSNVFYDSALGKVSGSAYNALTIEKIKRSVFPLPCLEEQQAIVDKVNSLMVLCDELEQQTENSQSQIEQLMQSCLKEVFEQESS
ncbi:restriction endonuclease subunit S [Flavobacteriaceae bacterium]|nr:restriction endonuclease subunit S [Flavobacteriaceae bacterium]